MKNRNRSKLFEELIIKSWWTILFFLLCLFAYDGAMQRKNKEENKLKVKLNELISEKKIAMGAQEDLKLTIASQNDESWIELVLMRKLGLVPEGQTKIFFIQKNEP